jgi:hypothetical protein
MLYKIFISNTKKENTEMKAIKLINQLVLVLFVIIFSTTIYAMHPAVAKEVCIQSAAEEEIPAEERDAFIRSCIRSNVDDENENQSEEMEEKFIDLE